MVPLRASPAVTTVTGSRRADLLLAAAVVMVMLLLAPRLRVYFQVTVLDVSVARVEKDGSRITIPTPGEFKRVGAGYWRGETIVAQLKPKIDAYMSAGRWAAAAPSDAPYEWTVRWSDDSLNLDHVEQITSEAAR